MNTIRSLQVVPRNGSGVPVTNSQGQPINVGQIIANVILGGETDSAVQARQMVDLAARLTVGEDQIELQNSDYELLKIILTTARMKVWIKAVVNETLLKETKPQMTGKPGGKTDGD